MNEYIVIAQQVAKKLKKKKKRKADWHFIKRNTALKPLHNNKKNRYSQTLPSQTITIQSLSRAQAKEDIQSEWAHDVHVLFQGAAVHGTGVSKTSVSTQCTSSGEVHFSPQQSHTAVRKSFKSFKTFLFWFLSKTDSLYCIKCIKLVIYLYSGHKERVKVSVDRSHKAQ